MSMRTLATLFVVGLIVGCGGEVLPLSKKDGEQDAKDKQNPQSSTSKKDAKERVKAEAGVGKKGQRLEQPHVNKIIAAPAKSLFAAQQRVVFDIQIPQALNLYRATNGNLPKTHDEFMSKIIKANLIKLPELPAGQKYVWDPKAGELMVERPASSS